MTDHITVVGAGLAGSEAAWQLAEMGIPEKDAAAIAAYFAEKTGKKGN